MAEQNTYTIVPDELVKAVGANGAIVCGKIATICGQDNTPCEMSNERLCELLRISLPTLLRLLDKLVLLGFIERKTHNGRGCVTTYKKGNKILPFLVEKKVTKFNKKGNKILPINYNNNIDGLTNAHERVTNQPIVSNLIAGDTPAPPIDMEQFDIFWRAFFFGSYAKYEKEQAAYKERAAAVFAQMDTTKRERMTREMRNGKRYDKSHFILWYIQNYNPAPSVWYAGDPELTADMVGWLQVLKYKGRVAYCAPGDVQALVNLGAQLF